MSCGDWAMLARIGFLSLRDTGSRSDATRRSCFDVPRVTAYLPTDMGARRTTIGRARNSRRRVMRRSMDRLGLAAALNIVPASFWGSVHFGLAVAGHVREVGGRSRR